MRPQTDVMKEYQTFPKAGRYHNTGLPEKDGPGGCPASTIIQRNDKHGHEYGHEHGNEHGHEHPYYHVHAAYRSFARAVATPPKHGTQKTVNFPAWSDSLSCFLCRSGSVTQRPGAFMIMIVTSSTRSLSRIIGIKLCERGQ